MNEGIVFPSYIPRQEEERIREEAALVREGRQSRAVLLYGEGGVGKTWLIRQLADASAGDETTVWLDPIDVDDPEFWLLSNLERRVAERLDPDTRYFRPYLDYLSRLPRYTRPRIGHETVVSHLGRIKRVFVECYRRFVTESGKTVVIALDTVEAIRGMYLLLTLTQWMKALPGTLFILSGRPLPGNGDAYDPIRNEFLDPYQPLPVARVDLAGFTEAAALDYLNRSTVASALGSDEKQTLVLLTRGHPLWLAFTLDYLVSVGIPEEAQAPLAQIERDMPYAGAMTPVGQQLYEAFKRRLVTPYRGADFWREAIKRLAVVRQGVNRSIWQRLMSDLRLPNDAASWDDAWEKLLKTPWIRPRAHLRYVTLHDAVAEELALRIIPMHDQDEQWRRELWRRAVGVYGELTERPGASLAQRLDEALQVEGEGPLPPDRERELIEAVARLDTEKRELDQLKAAGLYYQLLSDPAKGSRQFLALLREAAQQHDVLFQDLIAMEMQRFLPNGVHRQAFGEVIGGAVDDFQRWLSSEGLKSYLEIGLAMADYLIYNSEQPSTAMELLQKLPSDQADPYQRYRLSNQRGNACMRIPGQVREGEEHFLQALEEANELEPPERQTFAAQAHKELGFYYRNVGQWQAADDAYQRARDTISAILTPKSPPGHREEMASIHTNWAYVKGLRGVYGEGHDLVESAITVRRRQGRTQGEGTSWSVRGEVYRYERQFQKAWDSYQEAERIFHGLRSWSWLGLLYQEQAICLFQATRDGIELVEDQSAEAERRITRALDICREQAVRGYPSALNRAARIFAQTDPEAALRFLREGIDHARSLSDGRSWLANLIEYVELIYQAWVETGQPAQRDDIAQRGREVEQLITEYTFKDLEGRWRLLQGHLSIRDALTSGEDRALSEARRHYEEGFSLIAEGYVGSHGSASIASEFKRFGELFQRLRPEIQAAWEQELRRAWAGSTSLLARLDELAVLAI
jgi:tetratricopeptide (TPR) repeat protein